MLKELFVAIILGALLGFGITGGYFSLVKNTPPKTLPPTTPTPQVATTPSTDSLTTSPTPTDDSQNTSEATNTLTLDSPENESLVTNSKITLKGSTSPSSYVIAITPKGTYSTQANASGAFEFEVDIDSGANIISLTSVSQDDATTTSEVLVTYSTAKF